MAPRTAVDGRLQGVRVGVPGSDAADLFPGREPLSGIENDLIREDCAVVHLTAGRRRFGPPALRVHVRHVVSLVAQSEMLESDAGRVVASVQDVLIR